MTVHPATPWWLPIVMAAGLSLMSTLYINKVRNTMQEDQSTAQRLTAVETHQMDTTARLDRIESKLDALLNTMLK